MNCTYTLTYLTLSYWKLIATLFVCLFVSLYHINVPVEHMQVTDMGTNRSLLMGYNAILLQQIHVARDHLHVLSHRHDNTWTAFCEPVSGTGWSKLVTRR